MVDGGDRKLEAADKDAAWWDTSHIPDVQKRAFGNGMQGGANDEKLRERS